MGTRPGTTMGRGGKKEKNLNELKQELEIDVHKVDVDVLCKRFSTSIEQGLTDSQAAKGLAEHGMIGEVISGTADIALADMTITSKREEAVDFTHPYMSLGLGVLGYRGSASRSLQHLADDDSLKVGAFCCGSTAAALRNSPDPLYQKIWAKVQEDPENTMTNSNHDGVDKVLASRGTYVYIMESGSIDYQVARNCRLTQVGKTFLPRSYGLALAPGSPYREELNKGILMMQESGKMEMLVKKWIGLEGSECAAQQAGLIGWFSSML